MGNKVCLKKSVDLKSETTMETIESFQSLQSEKIEKFIERLPKLRKMLYSTHNLKLPLQFKMATILIKGAYFGKKEEGSDLVQFYREDEDIFYHGFMRGGVYEGVGILFQKDKVLMG